MSLHYNGSSSYLFVNSKKVIKFKTKCSEIITNKVYLGNIFNDFLLNNMIKTGLYGSVYDFSVDYTATAFDDILDMHKYLMEKNKIKWCLNLFKNVFFSFFFSIITIYTKK